MFFASFKQNKLFSEPYVVIEKTAPFQLLSTNINVNLIIDAPERLTLDLLKNQRLVMTSELINAICG